ncbi:hypothetical protein [Solicola gregarius]|uniref:Uncharacterized protein n=1 Tax=Solicola gregarius TaxID=2908642 RepID=A0AA46TGG7_9ACTN|nr:hypothetical protein [Solicola gregarius]UYM04103.1 hypothetical protein L0C25_16340 [Solicola gregarius]
MSASGLSQTYRNPDVGPERDAPMGLAARALVAGCWLTVAAAVVAVPVAVGVDAVPAFVYLLTWVASTTVPGVLVWRALAAPSSLAEEIGFGNVTGIALLLLAWVPAVLIGDATLTWWWPVTALVAFLAVPSLRRCWRPHRSLAHRTPLAWHCATALVCVVAVGYFYVTELRMRPLPGSGDTRVHPDLWFQQSLVNQLEHTLDVQQPQVVGEAMRYHWFANADAATTAQLSGVPSMTVTFVLWFVVLGVTMVLAAAAFARRLMGDDGTAGRYWWVGPAGALFVAGVPVVLLLGEPRQLAITSGFMAVSPSGVLGLVVMLGLSGAIIELLRGVGGRGTWALVVLLMALSVGTKPSNLPIAIAALVAVALVQYVRTRRLPMATVALVVVALVMIGASSFKLLGGSSGSAVVAFDTLQLDPAMKVAVDDNDGVFLVGTGVFGLYVWTQLPRLLGLLGIAYRRTRADIGIWWSSAVVFAGWCASWLVQQPGYSQRYFWRIVIVLAMITSVVVAVRVVVPLRARDLAGPLLTVGIAGLAVGAWVLQWPEVDVSDRATGPFDRFLPYGLALAVFAACVVGWRLAARTTNRAAVPLVTLALVFTLAAGAPAAVDDLRTPVGHAVADEPLPYEDRDLPRLVTEAEQDAGLWLRKHADDGSVVTNVYCVPTRYEHECQATAFWVNALSDLPMVLGGWAYTEADRGPTDREGLSYKRRPPPYPDRFGLSMAMIRDPDASVAQTLWSTYDARWIFADVRATEVSPRLARYADLVYRNDDVSIYRMHRP